MPATKPGYSAHAFAHPALRLEAPTGAQPYESKGPLREAKEARAGRPLLARLAGWWIRQDPLEPADAVLILAGDSAAGGRLQRGVELFRQGWAPLLILSGPPLRPYLNESDLMEQEALRAGLPRDALLPVPHRGASTQEEAGILLRTAAERGARRLLVVSSDFHLPRVRAVYRALAPQHGLSFRVVAAPDLRFDPAGWWRRRLGIVTLGFELIKNCLTRLELLRLFFQRRRTRRLGSPSPQPRSSEATGWFHPHRSPH